MLGIAQTISKIQRCGGLSMLKNSRNERPKDSNSSGVDFPRLR